MIETIIPAENTQEVKKEPEQYVDFAHSKQSFDKLARLEVYNGDLILRGRNGQRDHAYPLHRASVRFWRMSHIYNYWMQNGFFQQCQQWRYVLQDFGHKLQEAILERFTGNTSQPPPAFCNAKYMALLAQALKGL